MIEFSEFEWPFGKIAVAERRKKILLLTFGGKRAVRKQHPELWELDEVVDCDSSPSAQKINDYLRGKDGTLRVPVDTRLVSGEFDRKVLERLAKVRSGQTVSYGKLAELVGSPGAARAVGGAMRRNPIPIVLPCHRVLPQTGRLGNYTGGVEKKAWLLKREGVAWS